MCWYLLCNSSCQDFVCRVKYNNGEVGKVAQELYEALTSIQMGHAEDKMGWIVQLN
jgi:branched-chain amino acid aminotransferase